jgi:hypothetical protein
MQTYKTLSESANVPWLKKVWEIISPKTHKGGDFVADASDRDVRRGQHTTDDIRQIKSVMYDHVKSARVQDGQSFLTLDEFKAKVHDGFWNPLSGVGSVDDPGMYNYSYIPVSMSPQEATAYYASGGIPAIVTDKKAKGCLLNGYTFKGKDWTPDETKKLYDYAERLGFGAALADSLRDGLIYGGAICYPSLKQDYVGSIAEKDINRLIAEKIITQDCIDYFVTTDRWNCVLVPQWNVTARDYLTPGSYYIPIGGVEVATARSAIVRPKMLPYWGMLPQIGWGVSDFEGYITSVLSYQLAVASIPIMAQQMSLLFHLIPLDGAIAQNGISGIEDLIENNDQVMRSWSVLHPATVNSFGEIKAVERHYEGFPELVQLLQTDIGARAEIPQSVIFPSQPTGLADSRGEDILLKQAESVQKISITVAPQFKRVLRILAMSCFGPEYFNGKMEKLNTLALSFNPPIVQTNAQKAESAGKFADFIDKMSTAQIPLDVTLDLAKQFFPDVEISAEMMARLTAIPEGQAAPEYEQALTAGGLISKLVSAMPTPNLDAVLKQGDIAGKLAEFIGERKN